MPRSSCLNKMEPINISPHSDQKACFKTNVGPAIICLCLQNLIQLLFLLFFFFLNWNQYKVRFTVPKAKCDTNSFILLFSL